MCKVKLHLELTSLTTSDYLGPIIYYQSRKLPKTNEVPSNRFRRQPERASTRPNMKQFEHEKE